MPNNNSPKPAACRSPVPPAASRVLRQPSDIIKPVIHSRLTSLPVDKLTNSEIAMALQAAKSASEATMFLASLPPVLPSDIAKIADASNRIIESIPQKQFLSGPLSFLAQAVSEYGGDPSTLGSTEQFPRSGWRNWKTYMKSCAAAIISERWCPALVLHVPIIKLSVLNDILTRDIPEKERTALTDQFIFENTGEKYIAHVSETWQSSDLPSHYRRLLKETLHAYLRDEYGLVIPALSPLWEGIIRKKASLPPKAKSPALKAAVEDLASKDKYLETISPFYNECIMYQCEGMDEVIPDVPGRHAMAHGWFPSYPSRKAALNAISFTDFLLCLENL